MSLSDSFSRRHREEMKRLKRFRPAAIAGWILIFCSCIALISLTYFGFSTSESDLARLRASQQSLALSSDPNARRILSLQLAYQQWLQAHGIDLEYRSFARVSSIVLGAVTPDRAAQQEVPFGEIGSFATSTSLSIMRVSFVLLACWRIWFLVVMGSACWSFFKFRPYVADDLLGQTGNGRMYYSGIRSALENLAPDGAPDMQVVGLACPNAVPEPEVRKSALGVLLEEFGVDTETNIQLAGIILYHQQWPAFVAKPEDEARFQASFSGASLIDASVAILENTIKLAQHYRSSVNGAVQNYMIGRKSTQIQQALSLDQFVPHLRESFHRVLSPAARKCIGEADLSLVTTTVLAYQAGKVMAYAYEGERWILKSNFSQLTARAILHAVPAYGRDYRYGERNIIRRALIYGARTSVFGPVRFLQNLDPLSRALRQWIEILMSCPHELESISDEIELFGLVCEQRTIWEDYIFETLPLEAQKESSRIYATDTNLLLAPVETVVRLSRQCVDRAALDRIKELVPLVSHRQQERQTAIVQNDPDAANTGIHSYERIFSPLTPRVIEELRAEHGLRQEELSDWSALRVILHSHSWLARRVGDYSVPESSIIFAVLHGCGSDQAPNALGLVGRQGMIPFRASRFEDRWGKGWQTRFIPARSSNMAETREHYEKLMKGISDDIVDDVDSALLASG